MIHLPPKVLSSSSWQVSWLSLHRAGRLPNPRRAGSVAFLASPPRSQWRGRPGFTPGSLLSSQNNTRSNNAALLHPESAEVKRLKSTHSFRCAWLFVCAAGRIRRASRSRRRSRPTCHSGQRFVLPMPRAKPVTSATLPARVVMCVLRNVLAQQQGVVVE